MIDRLLRNLSNWLGGQSAETPASPSAEPSLSLAAGPVVPLVVDVWHGSGVLFDRFSLAMVGSGEGADGLCWGLHTSQDRRIGEHNAERRRFEGKGNGFLYRVTLNLDRSRVISLDRPETHNERAIGEHYGRLRSELGSRAAAAWLQGLGVQAVRGYEQERAATGDSIVCLDDALMVIQERYALRPPVHWDAI